MLLRLRRTSCIPALVEFFVFVVAAHALSLTIYEVLNVLRFIPNDFQGLHDIFGISITAWCLKRSQCQLGNGGDPRKSTMRDGVNVFNDDVQLVQVGRFGGSAYSVFSHDFYGQAGPMGSTPFPPLFAPSSIRRRAWRFSQAAGSMYVWCSRLISCIAPR